MGLAAIGRDHMTCRRGEIFLTMSRRAVSGNTLAVARSAYIDPGVFARCQAGRTIAQALDQLGATAEYGELATQGGAEAAVLKLLKPHA